MEIENNETSNLSFDDNFDKKSKNMLLFQFPKELFTQLKEKKSINIIANDMDDDARLITEDTTYQLKRYEYTNTFIISEHDKENQHYSIQCESNHILNVEKTIPNTSEIYNYLYERRQKESFFTGKLADLKNICTLNFLSKRFKISKAELLYFLKTIDCLVFNDQCCLIEVSALLCLQKDYLTRIKENQELFLNGFNIKEIWENTPYKELLDFEIFELINEKFNQKQEGQYEYKICLENVYNYANLEMFDAKKDYYYNEFKQLCNQLVDFYAPQECTQNLVENDKNILFNKSLNKLSYKVDNNNYSFYQSNNKVSEEKIVVKEVEFNQLSFDPKERIKQIYKLKQRFLFHELQNLFENLKLSKKQFEELIMKNCRTLQEKILKPNLNFFLSVYPELEGSLIPDRLNQENMMYKVYNSKK